jgi:imidazole glycerol-phosphate synthase subunit HisH
MKVAVVDYGAGNLRSVEKALEHVGGSPIVTDDPDVVVSADAIVVPGQGAAGQAMDSLRKLRLEEPLRQVMRDGKPFFGICLGMQILLGWSEEDGGRDCLGLVPGTVRRLPAGLKVPHMGWNQVHFSGSHPVFAGVPNGTNFYFVHSFYCDPSDPAAVAGQTEYGVTFCSAIAAGNLIATQFHPEKSAAIGLRIYANFLEWAESYSLRPVESVPERR